MVQLFRNYLKLRMYSAAVSSLLALFVLLDLSTTGVGGDSSASYYDDGSNRNGDSSMCRVIRNSKKSLLKSFSEQYAASNTFCDLSNHCSNITCSAEFSRSKVNAGLILELCQEDPFLQYWVDIPGQWDQQWLYTFPSKDFNGKPQRAEIVGNQNDKTNQSKLTKWFIKVTFSITTGRLPLHFSSFHNSKYLSIESVLQICQNAAEDSCTNTTLLNFPRLPQNQICDFTETASGGSLEGSDGSNLSSSRSSRNANAKPFDPHELRQEAARKALKYQNGPPLLATPGDVCDTQNIFSCSSGGTCVSQPDGSGRCHCMIGYTVNASSGTCIKKPAVPTSDDTSNADSLNSRSYSSAVGAIISIILLVGIAAGIFFGTKYHYFERIRHRLPVFRCWPFRRSQPWEDNVTMVNPLGPPDDDDPLLL